MHPANGAVENVGRTDLAVLGRLRLIALAFLAGLSLIAMMVGAIDSGPELLATCGALAVINALLTRSAGRGWSGQRLVCAMLAADVVGLTVLLHFGGDVENPLMFAYSLPVAAAALLLSSRASHSLATLAVLLSAILVTTTYIDASPVHLVHHHLLPVASLEIHRHIDPDLGPEGWNLLAAYFAALVGVVFATSFGCGALSRRLREKQHQIEIQNERLVLVLGALPEGVALLSARGDVLWTNDAAARLLPKIAPGGVVDTLDEGAPIGDRIRALDRERPIMDFETGDHDRRLAHVLVRAPGQDRVVWVFRDVGRERRLMARAMHDSKMVDLGLLAAGIAHEIGNPLSSMSAILQLVRMKNPKSEIGDRLTALENNLDRIGRVVRDITGFARPSEGKSTATDLGSLVGQALRIFRMHEKARGIMVEDPADPPPLLVHAVEDQTVQVVLNLLLNAADASPPGGTIEVRLGRRDAEAFVEVMDHGHGMDAATRTRLFTPFFTTKAQGRGVGLGLFISEAIVRALRGRIEVRSSVGEGTTMTVLLPLADVPGRE